MSLHSLHIELHPMLVHFPIAFYFLESLLLSFWIIKQDPSYMRFARFSFRLGYLFMILAIVAGWIDANGVKGISASVKVRTHFLSAAGVFTFYTLRAFYWRFAKENWKFYKEGLVFASLLGNILVALTGYFGGMLVYD